MGVLHGYTVYYNGYADATTIDTNLVPTSLSAIINDKKALMTELFQPNNISLRNSIIDFTQKMKVAMNFRSQNKIGPWSKIPWNCNIVNKKLTFHQMADQYYFLSTPNSDFNKVLSAAVDINRSLKLHMQYADNNRYYCPKYKLTDANGKIIPFFSQIVTGPNHRQALISKNNVIRLLLGGNNGFENSGYKVEYEPNC